ncbi:putative arm repeat-containing protein [Golovinomyces cichoracearum]|uniref:Pre-rRNA-processing protein RIX1 n=1 Tax=Golovinomyces cichoracearum TaxID=62708 RepID=A0A420IIZ8_9PEZI|nr:putative arm repeat-containing protein [Golovinomyces cichoracearum]
MFHSPELQILCDQLSTVPVIDLLYLLPSLSQNALCCKDLKTTSSSLPDASDTSVLLHKLRTLLTKLLNGKEVEGRFVAVILVKAYVDVKGLEEGLKHIGSWVRSLIAVLGKPDPSVTKELCVVTLTKLYILMYRHQNLVREISTPTLPAYITSCLNLLSLKSSNKASNASCKVQEYVLQSFALLIPRHASIFKPFSSQIRILISHFIAPSRTGTPFVSLLLRQSARHVLVCLHETAPKNTYCDEWSKSLGDVVKHIHKISDQVFRSVIENWESSDGYVGESVDINKQMYGGDDTGYLAPWSGIEAGIDKLIGMLETLAVYFQVETSRPVKLPLGMIRDMISRILSISTPMTESMSGRETMQIKPGIERKEQYFLWCQMPNIYMAVFKLLLAISERLQENFLPLASECFDHLTWVFPCGKHNPEFRLLSYELMIQALSISGKGLQKPQINKALSIIKSCCHDLYNDEISSATFHIKGTREIPISSLTNSLNINNSITYTSIVTNHQELEASDVTFAASRLLPHLLSKLPQEHLNISIRSLIERTAILSKNKEAMLSCVLNPSTGQSEKEMTSILPHLTRAFASDDVVEVLLRPRMPQINLPNVKLFQYDADENRSVEEEMDYQNEVLCSSCKKPSGEIHNFHPSSSSSSPGQIDSSCDQENRMHNNEPLEANETNLLHTSAIDTSSITLHVEHSTVNHKESEKDIEMCLGESDSDGGDDESVHLTMQLDTDSELSEDEANRV